MGSSLKSKDRQVPTGISVNASSSALCREKLLDTLGNLQEASELWLALQGSQHRNAHVNRLLSGYASTTILRYLSAFERFMQTAAIMEVALRSITAIALADIIVTLSLARSSDPEQGSGSVITVKSIRWAASHLQITSLSEVAWDPLIASFYQNRVPRDKKEACPLTLFQMTQLERRLLMAQASTAEVMILGSILAFAWASLRFSDGQRVELSSLQFDGACLRGVCYATKTCNEGVPFAVLASGFLSSGSYTWLAKWSSALDSLVSRHLQAYPEVPLPSSLFLALDATGEVAMPPLGAEYPLALKLLRSAIQLPWKLVPAKPCTP